jgi:hypothetical protein
MSRLEDLSNDKVTIMQRLIGSQNICKALYYADTNFLDQPDIQSPDELIYDKIYPYRYIPKVDEKKSSYITLSFRNYDLVDTSFKSGYIYINVLTHIDLIKTDYGWLRYDYILSEIDKLINMKNGIGIGKPQFHRMDELIVNDKYMGVYISYKLYEFN